MPHRLTWTRLLSAERAPGPRSGVARSHKPDPSRDERSPFEQDHDRIVFSQPFRRLARKTQVHPMASNDHIHNRLTHSIEVASVGRSFAARLARLATERGDLAPADAPHLAWIVQSACLVHDLGNPPFGHAGEEVIREWVAKHRDWVFPAERAQADPTLSARRADWLNFEGNAQGFRLAARADNPLVGYLRLTYATLGAAVKYPWDSADPRTAARRKHNVYSSEADLFRGMADALGLVGDDGGGLRHPLSFLTEAADDICYRIIDLEDAVEMGIRGPDAVRDLFLRICGRPDYGWMSLPQLRGQAIAGLMDRFWAVFEGDFDAIMDGRRTDDLKASLGDDCKGQLDEVKDVYEAIFGHRKKVATELGAYHVLGRILKALFKTAQVVCDAETYDDVSFLSKRTVELTWGRPHVEANLRQPYGWWLSQVMDFVSGMTDDYATRLSREIGGFGVDPQ